MLARGTLEICDDLLIRVLRRLPYRPLVNDCDVQKPLSWQILLIEPIGADVRDFLTMPFPSITFLLEVALTATTASAHRAIE